MIIDNLTNADIILVAGPISDWPSHSIMIKSGGRKRVNTRVKALVIVHQTEEKGIWLEVSNEPAS